MKPFFRTMPFVACCLCTAAALTATCQAGNQSLETKSSPLAPNPPALYEAAQMERLTPVYTTGELQQREAVHRQAKKTD